LEILKSSASVVETRNSELEKLVASYSTAITECKTVATLDKEKAKAIIQNLKKQLQKSEQLRIATENEKDMLLRDQTLLHDTTQQVLFDQTTIQRQMQSANNNNNNVVHIVPVPSVMQQRSVMPTRMQSSPFHVHEQCAKHNRLIAQPINTTILPPRDRGDDDYGTPASTGEWAPQQEPRQKSERDEMESQWKAQQHHINNIQKQQQIQCATKTVMPDPTFIPHVMPPHPPQFPKAAVAREPIPMTTYVTTIPHTANPQMNNQRDFR